MKILSKQLPKHPRHHHIWDSPYFYASMDFPIYLPYHKKICPNFFFGKSLAPKYPTYLQFGHMSKVSQFFYLGPSPQLFIRNLYPDFSKYKKIQIQNKKREGVSLSQRKGFFLKSFCIHCEQWSCQSLSLSEWCLSHFSCKILQVVTDSDRQ